MTYSAKSIEKIIGRYQAFFEIMPDPVFYEQDKVLGYKPFKNIRLNFQQANLGMTDSAFLGQYYRNMYEAMKQVLADILNAKKTTKAQEHREYLNFNLIMCEAYIRDSKTAYEFYERRCGELQKASEVITKAKVQHGT